MKLIVILLCLFLLTGCTREVLVTPIANITSSTPIIIEVQPNITLNDYVDVCNKYEQITEHITRDKEDYCRYDYTTTYISDEYSGTVSVLHHTGINYSCRINTTKIIGTSIKNGKCLEWITIRK